MNVLEKLVTAVRAGVTEVGEAIVDSQSLRILEQEIRDATDALNDSKDALAAMMARQKLSAEKAGKLTDSIREHEGYAKQALNQNDETLAKKVAEKIATLENDLIAEEKLGKTATDSVTKMRTAIQRAEKDLHYMKQQVDTIKATENVQRAEAAVSARHSGKSSKLRTAMESLERIKEKQALANAQMQAANDLAEEEKKLTLDEELEAAGIKDTAKAVDVLERLQKQ